jgi:hypothetical protein
MPELQQDESVIPLPQLPRELRALTGQEPPSYRTIYNMVVDDIIPAELVRGRWQIARPDLRGIAKRLGMIPLTPRFRGRTWRSSHAGRRKASPAAA